MESSYIFVNAVFNKEAIYGGDDIHGNEKVDEIVGPPNKKIMTISVIQMILSPLLQILNWMQTTKMTLKAGHNINICHGIASSDALVGTFPYTQLPCSSRRFFLFELTCVAFSAAGPPFVSWALKHCRPSQDQMPRKDVQSYR